MTAIKFMPLMPEHARIASHLRKADRDEITSINGLQPEIAVAFSIANSEKGRAVFINEELCAVFGISRGIIWLVGSDEISKHPIAFFRHSRRIFYEISKGYSYLENWVDARNSLSLRWLQWLGFSVEAPVSIGGVHAHHVYWKGD